ncbi:hypothetical protein [Mycobacterium sp. 94-17]|uniref:hypothetical protein n=1 Tax=Mycobacterium sp. 94-17 TaxID=2986147 RepID=UPI002D1F052B|nr:hypothetical protein [Mycobacterium sp. 94-17]MEB4212331.1 hypothetical protein [Mycobacterium sp. 94-17]
MTEPCVDPLPPLVTDKDPDWGRYQADDPEWFLRAAGELIRRFCGWHLAPNRTETVHKVKIGNHGVIMLPSRHVTNVEQVTIYHGAHPHTLQPDEFLWHEAGYIERTAQWFWNDGWYQGAYVLGSDPYYLPVTSPGYASITLSHGWMELPVDVKEVAFELAESAMALRGNTKMVEAPIGFRVQTSMNGGVNLNEEQIARLANFRIGITS